MLFSRLPTALESSRPAARFALGACSAIAFSARTSSWAIIATAVAISTAPSTRCTSSVRGSQPAPAEHQHEQDDRRAEPRTRARRAACAASCRWSRRPRSRPRGSAPRTACRRSPAPRRPASPDAEPVARRPWARSARAARAAPRSGAAKRRHRERDAEHEQHARSRGRAGRVSPSPTPLTTFASTATVSVNVTARPSTIPSGRRRPPVAPGRQQRGEDRQHARAHRGAGAGDAGQRSAADPRDRLSWACVELLRRTGIIQAQVLARGHVLSGHASNGGPPHLRLLPAPVRGPGRDRQRARGGRGGRRGAALHRLRMDRTSASIRRPRSRRSTARWSLSEREIRAALESSMLADGARAHRRLRARARART